MCFPLTFAYNGLGKVVVWSLKHSRSKNRGRKHSNNMLRSWRFTLVIKATALIQYFTGTFLCLPLSKFIDLSLTDQIRQYASLLKPLHGCMTQGNVKDTQKNEPQLHVGLSLYPSKTSIL